MQITATKIGLLLLIAISLGMAILLLSSVVAMGTQLAFAQDISDKERIMNRKNTGALLLDRHGTPFFSFYKARKNDFVTLAEISDQMELALIAAEDKRFYTHSGYSSKSIVAAMMANLNAGAFRYGGSTITQQLVKITLLHSKKNILRKYQEIILAQELEKRYSKAEILEMYLNSAYFGQGAFGVNEAAQTYFGVSAKDLTVGQAALLAGLLRAPSELSQDVQKAKERQRWVIEEMRQTGYLSHFATLTALNENVDFNQHTLKNVSYEAPHFALMVKDWLVEIYGEEKVERGGFVVHTGLDLNWQKFAEGTVAQQVLEQQKQRVSNGAAVVIDLNSGEVRAMVGSVGWDNNNFGKVNMANIPRQPGSAFKPLVYLTAFEEKAITPASILKDKPTIFASNYKPENYDKRYRGNVTARYALANSLNVPTVALMTKIGVPSVLAMAQRLGITSLSSPSNYGPSLGLGAGEVTLLQLTNAYAALARNGNFQQPILVTRIEDKNGKEIYAAKTNFRQAVAAKHAFLVTSILSDTNTRKAVFGNALTTKTQPTAVKTGTTQGYRDGWTMGYTPNIAVGVWIGNNDNTPMDRLSGSLGAAPIWKRLIDTFSAEYEAKEFLRPGGIIARKICAPHLATAQTEYFVSGTEPTRDCVVVKPTPPAATPEAQPEPEKEKKDKEA